MAAKLCITVTAPTTAELRRRRDRVRDADLVELRLDSVSDPDVAGALAGRSTPAIVTCRPKWEGGLFTGSEEERRRLLEQALALGAEYVDVEWKAAFDDLIALHTGGRVVLSMHDFAGTPPDLIGRAAAMRATGANVIKLAVKANRLSDCLALVDVSKLGDEGRSVLIAMGEQGVATRILPERFGSAWTYAGSLADVGQLDSATLLDAYRFRSIDAATSVYGLVGSPVSHSVSPAMHNAAFAAAGIDAVYLPLPACDADDFMTFAHSMGLSGASVTIPFKVSLFDRMDGVDAVATQIGAINTIHVVDGRWMGTNTDCDGFLTPLHDRGVSLARARAAILGAGGSARAVAVALARGGAAVTVHARNAAQAERLAVLVSGRAGVWPIPPGAWDIVVNCTPIGMHPRGDETPVPESSLTGRLVYDLVYNPPVTRLLRQAARAGCVTIGGLDMLVAQAEEQFRIWTGVRPPAGVMRTAALNRLAEFVPDENHVV